MDDISYGDSLCRQAVDLSQGELIEINIEFFGSDDLLNYISQRSSHLRRLRLAFCGSITIEGLSEAVKKFPELKDLHLSFMPWILAADIQTIGISCPMLQSFSFSYRASGFEPLEVDEYAVAVGKTMPNLRHLRLFFDNRMRYSGVDAIFDGCRHLKSLDLRRCFCVDLADEFSQRFSEQMKGLRFPSYSCSDCRWHDDDNYSDGDYDD